MPLRVPNEFKATHNPLDYRNLWLKLDDGMLAVLGYAPTAVFDWMCSTEEGRREALLRSASRCGGSHKSWVTLKSTEPGSGELESECWAPADVIYRFAYEVAGVVPEALIDEGFYAPLLLYRVVFAAMREGMSMKELYDAGWGYVAGDDGVLRHRTSPQEFRTLLMCCTRVRAFYGGKSRLSLRVSFYDVHCLCSAVGLEVGDVVVSSRMKKIDGAQVSIHRLLSLLDGADMSALCGVAAALAGSHGPGKDGEAVKREVMEVLNWWDTVREKG